MIKNKPISARQKLALEIWIKNGRKSKAKALSEAGYSKSVIKHPSRVFGSDAVMNELYLLGYGETGIETNAEFFVPEIEPQKDETINIDFANLPESSLKELKARLKEIPDFEVLEGQFLKPQSIEQRPLPPSGTMEGAFDSSKADYSYPERIDNYSSM